MHLLCFIGGQGHSTRFNALINKKQTEIVKLVERYNVSEKPVETPLPPKIDPKREEVRDAGSNFWSEVTLVAAKIQIDPLFHLKRQLLNDFGMLKSARKERALLKADEENLKFNLQLEISEIEAALDARTQIDPVVDPSIVQLSWHLTEKQRQFQYYSDIFKICNLRNDNDPKVLTAVADYHADENNWAYMQETDS